MEPVWSVQSTCRRVHAVSAGRWHTCGLRTDGTAACWGGNDFGQASPPAGAFTQVNVGVTHTCGVRIDDAVACWGMTNWGGANYGQAIPPGGTFGQVSTHDLHTCGVRTNGAVACWGSNTAGESSPPAGSFAQLGAGGDGNYDYGHTCGVRVDGTVACWGGNNSGQASPPAGAFSQVSAGGYHTCAVRTGATSATGETGRTSGTVACLGSNDSGQASPPAGVFSQVSAGGYHTCGIRIDGTVACWGWNELGPGQSTGRPRSARWTPVISIPAACGPTARWPAGETTTWARRARRAALSPR